MFHYRCPSDAIRSLCLFVFLLESSFVTSVSVPRASNGLFTISQNAKNPIVRSAALLVKQIGFTYGPPVAGGPYFPSGVLGLAKVAADQVLIQLDEVPEIALSAADAVIATASASQYDGLDTLDDYTKLYDGQWKTTLPSGPSVGMLSNYTQDLLFSMERLSNSPYAVKRLDPSKDTLQFQVEDSVATTISGTILQNLLTSGLLFYSDYRSQKNLEASAQFGAACDAYFYINQTSKQFLPLAIRTNVGSNLVYTPLDDNSDPDKSDWLLAKIMYNANDFWFAQWNHLASTHEVVQIAYLAAIRAISDDHPVLALLNRLMYEVYAIQPLAATLLFAPDAVVDQVFSYTGEAAQGYTTNLYQNGSGRFQSNYFLTDLASRGLINATTGPALDNFPFYEDALAIYSSISKFMTTFVNSYYTSDADVTQDKEIQAWVKEAQGPAAAIDFPTITTRRALIDALTHMAHLASTSHHTVNTNELLSVSSTLPFHPSALYKAPPTTKGDINVVDYLPPLTKVIEQFGFAALFARPLFLGTNRTLLHMFEDAGTVGQMNSATQAGAATFKAEMQAFSSTVSSRTFNSLGLSQGMPFVWKALDPSVAPFSITS